MQSVVRNGVLDQGQREPMEILGYRAIDDIFLRDEDLEVV